jgi:putative transposase
MNRIPKAFFKAEPGLLVRSGERSYKITHLLSVDSVLAVDMLTNESTRLRVDSISVQDNAAAGSTDGQAHDRDLSLYRNEEWAEAQRRFQAIKPLLENPLRTRADADHIAEGVGIHTATLYKWLKLYQHAGHVSALVPTKRGRKVGSRLLADEQEKIIESAIEDLYLNKQRHKPQDIIEEVQRRARLAKTTAPHPNTVRSRIADLRPADALRRRGYKEQARNRYAPILGEFPNATHPLAVVQIDHTEVDIILVDEANRKPIGRPWISVAIDVYSRMIAGIYLSFEKPSSAAVGMCISHAVCPKREYLAELGVSGDWPVWGVMNVIHVDNAKEFRGVVLERACEEYSIDLQWRPVLLPHYGGNIERWMGTMANEIRKLPGATFSNPVQRKGYDSEAKSALTLREFEQHLVDFIVNVYHQRRHSQINMPPRAKWEHGVLGDAETKGTGLMPIPEDPLRIQLDFMPYFERSVQQYGIQIDGICYYEKALDPYINCADLDNPKAKRKFLVRRDPRDIGKVYFFDPADNRYVPLPYRDIGHPAMSLWELKEVQRTLKEQGFRQVDEHLIFEALDRMRARVEEAQQKTKAARRQATRIPVSSRPAPKLPEQVSSTVTAASLHVDEDDPFAQPIRPFEDLSVSR